MKDSKLPRADRRAKDLFANRNALEVGEPHIGDAVGRRAPVAAGRERAARSNLGAVWKRAPLELARLEKALEENAQPLLDLRERVLVLPCAPRQEGNLRGRVAEAQHVVKGEI